MIGYEVQRSDLQNQKRCKNLKARLFNVEFDKMKNNKEFYRLQMTNPTETRLNFYPEDRGVASPLAITRHVSPRQVAVQHSQV